MKYLEDIVGRRKKYTEEELIKALKNIGKQTLSKIDVDKNPNIEFGSMTVIRHFGSWNKAMKMAGLNHGKVGRKRKMKKPNLMDRKKPWVGDINFPKTNNISNDPKNTYANEIIVWKGTPLTQKYLRSIDEDMRDEIAKDLLNFFMEYDFMASPKYTDKELKSSWNSLKKNKTSIEIIDKTKYIYNAGAAGYKLYHHFFPNLVKVRGSNRRSIYDVICDKKLLWASIRNRIGNTLLYGGELNKNLGSLQFPMQTTISQHLVIGCKNSGLASMASIFKPNVAKAVYDMYACGDVLDYSCGFGTRLLGFMACNKKDVKYYGYEPNTETYNNLQRMISYFGFNAEIKCCGSESELFDKKFSFIFSSPPYFDAEIYCDENTQSVKKFPEYNVWLENYWRQTVKNIKIMLQDQGIFAVNVGNGANKKMQTLETDMTNIIHTEGFKHIDTIWMKTSRSHLSNKKGGENYKLEGIFFYKKGN